MHRVSRNTLILFVNNTGGAVLSFISAVIIGRELGQTGLGQYAFALAWITPFTMLADFGFGTLITRDAARDKTQIGTLLRIANRTLPIIAGLAWLACVISIITAELSRTTIAAVVLGSLLIVLDPWYGLYTAAFRAFEQMQVIMIVNVGGLFLQLALTILFIQDGAGVIGAMAAVIFVNIGQLLAIWLWWRIWHRPHATQLALSASPFSQRTNQLAFLRRAVPFAIAAVIGALSVRMNILLLDRFVGDAAAGQYSAANRFVEAGRMFPNAAFGALFPVLAAIATNELAFRRFFQRSLVILCGVSSFLAISLTLMAPLLVRLSYGATFNEAIPVLVVLGWSLLPATGRGLLSLYLYSRGQEGVVNLVGILTLIMQAGIGVISITSFGSVGAAFTAVLAESVALLALWWFSRGQL